MASYQSTLLLSSEFSDLSRDLASHGLDLCHPFHPSWYNDFLDAHENLSSLIRLPKGPVAFLIGNTKSIWRPFIDWVNTYRTGAEDDRKQKLTTMHPLDTYVEMCLDDIFASHATRPCFPSRYTIFWGHHFNPDRLVSMQRVALVSGLAHLDEKTLLTVHPVFGAWTSYRAVVVFHSELDAGILGNESTVPGAPLQVPNLLTPVEEEKAALAMQKVMKVSQEVADEHKEHVPEALSKQLHGCVVDRRIADALIALRDCIEIGKVEYRFGSNQLLYHYTKDQKYLQA